MWAQVRTNELAAELRNEKKCAANRAEAIAVGTKILPSDCAFSDAANRAVKADGKFELVYYDSGQITGVREKVKTSMASKIGGYIAG
jgi:hypothetical protein